MRKLSPLGIASIVAAVLWLVIAIGLSATNAAGADNGSRSPSRAG